jgi:hypothetical protein
MPDRGGTGTLTATKPTPTLDIIAGGGNLGHEPSNFFGPSA